MSPKQKRHKDMESANDYVDDMLIAIRGRQEEKRRECEEIRTNWSVGVMLD